MMLLGIKFFKKKAIVTNIVILLFIVGCKRQSIENFDPDVIMAKSKNTYKQLNSYSDSGEIATTYGVLTKFDTYFKRQQNSRLFFYKWAEYKTKLNITYENWILDNGYNVTFFIDTGGKEMIQTHNDIDDGIASVYSVSDGSFRLIPDLLFENLGFQELIEYPYKKFIGIDIVDSVECFHLFVSNKQINEFDEGFHLWMDMTNGIIRKAKRIEEKYEISYFYGDIKINNAIDDEIFNTPLNKSK